MSECYVPASRPLDAQTGGDFAALVRLMRRLLAPDGCPWDREQTFASLRPYVLEEAAEVIDAVDSGERDAIAEELGDLALQIAFMAELGRREGAFGPDDVMRAICEKLVRRHPHVFGDVVVAGADEVLRNWQAIKRTEKQDRPLLGGIARALPALLRAARVGRRVAQVGFDWPDGRGSRAKVTEELAELDEAVEAVERAGAHATEAERAALEHELGDVLFALVNFARHLGLDAERALQATTDRFTERFAHVEQRVRETHGGWPVGEDGKPVAGLPLAELDGHWEEAKRAERARAGRAAKDSLSTAHRAEERGE